jgi:hypothetical protein
MPTTGDVASQYCYKHGRCCPLTFSAGGLRGVIAGVLCFDWSSRGARKQLMGFDSSMLLLQFMRDRVRFREDFAIVECTVLFHHGVFEKIAHIYSMTVIVVCSSLFGAPCTRRRKLMFLLRRDSLVWHRWISDVGFEAAFQHLFGADCSIDSRIYFAAPRAAVNDYRCRHLPHNKSCDRDTHEQSNANTTTSIKARTKTIQLRRATILQQ